LTATLPFKSATGAATVLTLPTSATFNISGEFKLDVAGAAISGPVAKDGISIAGFTLRMGAMDIHFAHPGAGGKAFEFNVKTASAAISTPIPNLLTQDDSPLTIVATNLGIDQDGQVSFSN